MANTYTSKFCSILPYVIMEYRYTTLPDVEEYPVNFGPTTVGYEKIYNGYTNSVQILNRLVDIDVTGNTRARSVVEIGNSTFVTLDPNYIVPYIDYDNKLTDTANLPVTFPSNILVQYDTIRFHILSGFNFPASEGILFQVKFQENSGKKAVVAQIALEKSDADYLKLNPVPVYFNGGIYDKFLEVKIPAFANMTYEYDLSVLKNETLAGLISSDGNGFSRESPFSVTAYEIVQTQVINGYTNYFVNYYNSAVLNSFDEYGDLEATLVENANNNYWEYYPTWQNEFIEQFIYTENSLGNDYYVINDITVSEQIGLNYVVTSEFQTIQTNSFNEPKIFRPIITSPRATSFNIDYTMRLVNKKNNISIIRKCSVTSYETDTYGYGLNKIQLRNDPYPLKVYNKVVESAKITSAYNINVNPINNIITKYVPAFFSMENVSVSEQDLTINNTGVLTQTTASDSTVAYGQGNLKIVVNPFDNYYKFRIFNTNPGKENTILDLGTNSSYYLVFTGDNNKSIKVASLTDAAFQNPTKGEIAFRVVEADSKSVQNFTNRDFHITAVSPNGIETSIYYGTWILPSERQIKSTGSSGTSGVNGSSGTVGSSGTSGTASTASASSVINTTNVNATVSNIHGLLLDENIKTSNIKTVFYVSRDNIVSQISPVSLSSMASSNVTTSAISGNTRSIASSLATIDLTALANSITGDETLGKTRAYIVDYYLTPGKPGYNTYKGITSTLFMSAVKRVYPDINGDTSPEYKDYASLLSFTSGIGNRGISNRGGISNRI